MSKRKGSNLSAVWILIGINLLLFIVTELAQHINYDLYQDLFKTLGLQPESFTEKPWTIVTSMFMHLGFWHIFGNMITLFFFGTYVSRLIGENKFLLIYFLGGLLGNVFCIILGTSDYIYIGASGAVFAVGGALTVLRPNLKVIIFPIPAPLPLWIAVLGMFLVISLFPNVAWEAHLGGLLLGLAAGYIFRKKQSFFI